MGFDQKDLPRTFGAYRLKEKLASGGMAELYLAEAKGPGGFTKPVVIKMIHRIYSDDARFESMFTEEAKIVAGLPHGNIVPVLGFGREEGQLYLAMELIDGVDASTLMDMCRRLGLSIGLDVALWIGMGTASALAHAHQARGPDGRSLEIVHRDVSPHNILLSRSGEVKLCDFGLAAWAPGEQQDDNIKGKLRYLSPEQAVGDKVDARSDIFSLGVVLYELLAGHHPVLSGTQVMVLDHLSEKAGYPRLTEAASWLPVTITRVVDRAIEFDKSRRYGAAEELSAELSKLLYQQFPEFTPKRLASLVVQVQQENEKRVDVDEGSRMRARMASFASSGRSKAAVVEEKDRPRPVRTRSIVVLAATALVVAAIALLLLPGRREATTREAGSEVPKPPGLSAPNLSLRPAPLDSGAPAVASLGETGKTPGDGGASLREASATEELVEKRSARKKRATGLLDVNAVPWAEVTIDGERRSTTPVLGLSLAVGRHKAVFFNPEIGATKTHDFVIKAGETTRVVVKME